MGALQRVVALLGELEGVSLTLHPLQARFKLLGFGALVQLVNSHYLRSVVPQMPKILASASVFGQQPLGRCMAHAAQTAASSDDDVYGSDTQLACHGHAVRLCRCEPMLHVSAPGCRHVLRRILLSLLLRIFRSPWMHRPSPGRGALCPLSAALATDSL